MLFVLWNTIGPISTGKMFSKIQQKADSVQVPFGYGVAAGLASTPVWVTEITTWFELIALFIGICVGATTIWLNIVRIRKEKGGE